METLKFKTSLKCGGCVAAIKTKMDSLVNVSNWEVDLSQPIKVLTVEGENLNEKLIVSSLEEEGYSAQKI